MLQLQTANGEALALLTRATSELTPGTAPEEPARAPAAAFDWESAEAEVAGIVEPAFVDGGGGEVYDGPEEAGLRLADVGGMEDVKRRLEMTFFGPMRNPELKTLYGKSLSGGLLLYGPPGCGKTFLARAVAASSERASTQSRSRTCSTCGSARASATCARSSRSRGATRPACCSSTRSTPSARSARTCGRTPPCAAR